jgi:hypothetical protein
MLGHRDRGGPRAAWFSVHLHGTQGGVATVDAQDFRAMARRCNELLRIAVRDDVREQLQQWADDFEAEAEALEKAADRSRAR